MAGIDDILFTYKSPLEVTAIDETKQEGYCRLTFFPPGLVERLVFIFFFDVVLSNNL